MERFIECVVICAALAFSAVVFIFGMVVVALRILALPIIAVVLLLWACGAL